MLEEELKPRGRSGYFAIALVILTVLILLSLFAIRPDWEVVRFISLIAGLLLAFIFAFKSFSERGIANRLVGAASIVLGLVIFYADLTSHYDYASATRHKLTEGITLGGEVKVKVTYYYVDNKRFPNSNSEVGIKEPSYYSGENVRSVTVGKGGRITIEFKGGRIDGQTILLTPFIPIDAPDVIAWTCDEGGTIPDEVRPPSCRSGTTSNRYYLEN